MNGWMDGFSGSAGSGGTAGFSPGSAPKTQMTSCSPWEALHPNHPSSRPVLSWCCSCQETQEESEEELKRDEGRWTTGQGSLLTWEEPWWGTLVLPLRPCSPAASVTAFASLKLCRQANWLIRHNDKSPIKGWCGSLMSLKAPDIAPYWPTAVPLFVHLQTDFLFQFWWLFTTSLRSE